MAEALAVVGVVASIVQLVEFGSKVLLRLNEFQSMSGEIPKTFQHAKAELPVLLETLEQTKTAISTGSLRDETKKALLPAIDGCRTQIESLDIFITKVLPLPSDSWTEKSRKSILSLRQDAKIRKVRTDLQCYIQTLTYYHAAASSTLQPSIVPSIPRTPSSTVPFRRDPDFVDSNILSEIHKRCSQPASRAALIGLGGVGKSQLAIEYSYRIRQESPSTWVFWVHAGTAARFGEGYRRIAEKVQIPGWDKPEIDILQLVSDWMCDEANGRWVLIVDNADDLAALSQQGGSQASSVQNAVQVTRSLSDFLPQSPNGSILITSRNRDVAYRLVGRDQDLIKVKPMDQEHAVALLRKKLPGDLNEMDSAELVQALDCMPLAIAQAAAYIGQRAPRATVSKYLHDLRGNDKERENLLKKDTGDTRRDGRASNSIITTWQISFEYIRKEWSSAARLLSLMSLFDCQGIPESLLCQSYQKANDIEANFENDISILTSYSLVAMNNEGNEFEMHRLVQFSTKKWLELHHELEHWKERYIEIIDQNFPFGCYENWTACQYLFPHAQMVLSYWPTNEEYLVRWASILHNAACYSDDKGNYDIAEEMNLKGLEGLEKALGAEHSHTLMSMNNLALTYWNQGRWAEAEDLLVLVMETSKRVLGQEHPHTLMSMASTYENQGRWKDAEDLQVLVMETSRRLLGQEHLDTLQIMLNLALTYCKQGRWKEAEDLQVLVTETFKRVLGQEHPDTLISMNNLALTYGNQGRWNEAEDLQVLVMEMRKRVMGKEHPDTLMSMNNLASTYWNQGRWKEAGDLQVLVMEIGKRVFGQDHPDMLMNMNNLALIYWNQGRWEDAEDLQVLVMETRKKVLGQEHPDTLLSMQNLAFLWHEYGRNVDAVKLMEECVLLRTQTIGANHPDTVSSTMALLEWQAQNLDVSSLAEESPASGDIAS